MRSDRAFNAALNVDQAQEDPSEEGSSEAVNIMDHREKQRRQNDGQSFWQDRDHARPLLRQTRVKMPKRKNETREDKQPEEDLFRRAAGQRNNKRVVNTFHVANARLNERTVSIREEKEV